MRLVLKVHVRSADWSTGYKSRSHCIVITWLFWAVHRGQQLCFRMSLCGCKAHIHLRQEIRASPGPALTCAPSWLRPCSPVGSEALLNSSHAASTSPAFHYFPVALTINSSSVSVQPFFLPKENVSSWCRYKQTCLLLGFTIQQSHIYSFHILYSLTWKPPLCWFKSRCTNLDCTWNDHFFLILRELNRMECRTCTIFPFFFTFVNTKNNQT